MRSLLALLLGLSLAGAAYPASSGTNGGFGPDTDRGVPSVGVGSPVLLTVVAIAGIAAWDALPEAEKSKLKTGFQSFFLHQSVGQDLQDGAEAVGFAFGYAASGSTDLAQGLNGGLFTSRNGDPSGKIAEFRSMARANQATVRVAIMKFGYADVEDGLVTDAQTAYQAAVADIKAQGVRVLHVTPPLVYDLPASNAPKMAMRTWMMTTFPDDIIFDLADLESTEPASGTRCERGGSWEICNSVRSTSDCQSLSQGIDAPSGQGHICYDPHAQRFARAFLYAIYLAGTGGSTPGPTESPGTTGPVATPTDTPGLSVPVPTPAPTSVASPSAVARATAAGPPATSPPAAGGPIATGAGGGPPTTQAAASDLLVVLAGLAVALSAVAVALSAVALFLVAQWVRRGRDDQPPRD